MKRLKIQKSPIWLSYDLGPQGDYEGMYHWLDTMDAKECGDSVAFMQFDFGADLPARLLRSIKKEVTLNKSDRIYLVFTDSSRELRGRFLQGKRKRPPWQGMAIVETEVTDDMNLSQKLIRELKG